MSRGDWADMARRVGRVEGMSEGGREERIRIGRWVMRQSVRMKR